MGVEFNPDMVALSRKNAQAAGVADKATFVQGDIFKTDFSKADVVTLFLLLRA
jgi:23S rRNA G2445 N2-methylase RlmL